MINYVDNTFFSSIYGINNQLNTYIVYLVHKQLMYVVITDIETYNLYIVYKVGT